MSTKRFRPDGPFCWQAKDDLRRIRDAFDGRPGLANALAVFTTLTEFASDDHAAAFSRRQSQIAERAGVSRRTVTEALRVLKAAGVIDWEQATGDGGVHPLGPSVYSIPSAMAAHPSAGNAHPCAQVEKTNRAQLVQEESLRESPEERKPASRAVELPLLSIPEALNREPFVSAWAEWTESRQKGRKPSAGFPALFTRQLAHLAQFGAEVAAATIQTSLRNGWQGLFPPTNGANPAPNGKPPSSGLNTPLSHYLG